MSDVGILNSPGDVLFVLAILGLPALFAGAVIGALVGYLVRRKRRPLRGSAIGAGAGLVVGAAGFAAWATFWL